MLGLFAATTDISYNTFVVVLIIGVVIGVAGHIIRSSTLILAGILILGLVSAFFVFQFLAQPQ